MSTESATHTKIDKRESVRSSISVDAASNKVTAESAYTDAWEDWEDRAPAFYTEHDRYPGLYLVKMKGQRLAGEMVEVVLGWEGFSQTLSYPGRPVMPGQVKRYSMEVTTTEEPLLTHDDYSTISDDERRALQSIMSGQEYKDGATSEKWEDDVTSTEALEALGKIKKGMTSYLEPRLVWVERFTASNLSDADITDMGKVTNPPGSPPSGGSRDYLYVGSTAQQSDDGESYAIERRWWLSGKNGWDSIYTA